MVRITLGAHLARVKTARAAVVPYIVRVDTRGNKKLHFLLARDQDSGDITDLGGGVKQNEYALLAALREFREESDEIFGSLYYNINNLATNVALLGERMSVIFIPLPDIWYDIAPEKFSAKRLSQPRSKKRSHDEVSELLWIDEDEFRRLISPRNRKMWVRVRKFYQKGYDEQLRRALKIVYSY